MPPVRSSAAPVRLARLDGLRAIAACGVAFTYHARLLFAEGTLDSGHAVLDWFHLSGWLFVDMFFVLSGYIFAHVYLAQDSLRRPGGLAPLPATALPGSIRCIWSCCW